MLIRRRHSSHKTRTSDGAMAMSFSIEKPRNLPVACFVPRILLLHAFPAEAVRPTLTDGAFMTYYVPAQFAAVLLARQDE